MKEYREIEAELHSFLNLALAEETFSVILTGLLTP
jgi:hypothetical protein